MQRQDDEEDDLDLWADFPENEDLPAVGETETSAMIGRFSRISDNDGSGNQQSENVGHVKMVLLRAKRAHLSLGGGLIFQTYIVRRG